jgi:phosphatidylglycerol---prolipoprotein diacylglyceryl transferase
VHPTLWKFHGIELHSYGLLLAVAFLLGIQIFVARARARGIAEEPMHALSLWLLVLAIAGGRLLFVLTHWSEYAADPLAILRLWEGGLILYGGYIAAITGGILFVRRLGIPVWRVGDAAAPSMALGVAIGRIGCFMNGCCYGLPTTLPWGVHFPPETAASYTFPGSALHPSQLYLSGASFLLFIVLLAFDRKRRFDGWLFTRYYDASGAIGSIGALQFNMNQIVSGFLILTSAVMLAILSRRREVPAVPVAPAGPASGPAATA